MSRRTPVHIRKWRHFIKYYAKRNRDNYTSNNKLRMQHNPMKRAWNYILFERRSRV